MLLTEFDYQLPEELIAKFPLSPRSSSRLLCLNKKNGEITHRYFKDLPNLLAPQDLLILNNTKVIPARLYAHKPTGGKVEILIERIIGENRLIAQTKTNRPLKIAEKLILTDNSWFEIINRQNNLFELLLHSPDSLKTILETFGQVPLPPYIKRLPNVSDQQQYQTIYAKIPGAVAAPTAGLHFDQQVMTELQQKNIQTEFITLHVGLGTFEPVRVQKIEDHKIHTESIGVSATVCNKIAAAKKNGSKIIAVGTTTIRALETAYQPTGIKPYRGETNIFIYPNYNFQSADVLITNFHLPKTSLLMLVAAFAGYKNTMNAYQEAIKLKYRFYSYGDAMMIF